MRRTDGTKAAPLSMGPAEWGLLAILSVLWGGSFFFVGVAVDDLPALTIVLVRVALAALALWVFVWAAGRPVPCTVTALVAFAGMGLVNNAVPFSLIVLAQQSVASGVAAILNATTPLFTVLVAGVFLADERFSAEKLIGVLIGFSGVVALIGPDVLAGMTSDVLAQTAILAAAISYAFAGVFGRRFKRLGIDPIVAAAGQVTASSLILLPVTMVADRPWSLSWPGNGTLWALIGLAVLSTALAYGLYFTILARAGPTNLLLVTFLIPVSATFLGVSFLGEVLRAEHLVGMALIGIGLAAIDGRLLARFRRPDVPAKP